MDNKTLSDFMPKVSSEGEITYGEISSSQLVTLTNDHIIKVLTDIKDPEMDMNIYDLGLIYDISIDNFNNIKIIMTLTTVNCNEAKPNLQTRQADSKTTSSQINLQHCTK